MLSRASGIPPQNAGPLRGRAALGFGIGLAIGLLGGVLEGVFPSIHGGIGMILVAVSYMVSLAGVVICAGGWLLMTLDKQPAVFWKRGLPLFGGVLVGQFVGFYSMLALFGRQ